MQSKGRNAFFLQKVSVLICLRKTCAFAGLKNLFVAEGFVGAVGWVELALKDLFAFVPAPSQLLLTFPSESSLKRRKEPRLIEHCSMQTRHH